MFSRPWRHSTRSFHTTGEESLDLRFQPRVEDVPVHVTEGRELRARPDRPSDKTGLSGCGQLGRDLSGDLRAPLVEVMGLIGEAKLREHQR